MTVVTYSQARQNLATLLDLVLKQGRILIKRKDGNMFEVTKTLVRKSPLDVPSIKTKMTTSEIVQTVRDMRSRAS